MEAVDPTRAQAEAAIRSGRLPGVRPVRMWGGPGEGARCTICGAPVRSDEIEFELEFPSANGAPPPRHQVHSRCFAAWEAVLQNHAQHPPGNGLSASPNGDMLSGRGAGIQNGRESA